jgi:hypothetical protein
VNGKEKRLNSSMAKVYYFKVGRGGMMMIIIMVVVVVGV